MNNLTTIRQMLIDLRATGDPGTTAFYAKMNRAIGLALRHLASDFAEGIAPDDEHVVLLPQVLSGDTEVDSLVNVTSDRYVLKFTTSAGLNLGSRPGGWFPTIDGTWDGVMHLEVQDADEVWHRRQSREWWYEAGDPPTYDSYYVSIDRQWPAANITGLNFRIYMPYFYVQGDVIRVLKPARLWDETRQNVYSVTPHERYSSDLVDFRGQTTGLPDRLFQVGSFLPGKQMLVPYTAPVLSALGTVWAGPEQEGTFEFCYTYVWGKRDLEWGETPGAAAFAPMWESPPSKTSTSAFSHTSNPGVGVRITCASPDQMLNFGDVTTVRDGRSGYKIRLYVRRTAVRTAGLGDFDNVDADTTWYLLDEFDPATAAPAAIYDWNGSVIPDRLTRLGPTGVYRSFAVSPYPDARYELDLRVVRMPVVPEHDQDVIPIAPDALPAFMELALSYFARVESGDQVSADDRLARYMELMEAVRDNHAQPSRVVEQHPFGIHFRRTIAGPFEPPS